ETTYSDAIFFAFVCDFSFGIYESIVARLKSSVTRSKAAMNFRSFLFSLSSLDGTFNSFSNSLSTQCLHAPTTPLDVSYNVYIRPQFSHSISSYLLNGNDVSSMELIDSIVVSPKIYLSQGHNLIVLSFVFVDVDYYFRFLQLLAKIHFPNSLESLLCISIF